MVVECMDESAADFLEVFSSFFRWSHV